MEDLATRWHHQLRNGAVVQQREEPSSVVFEFCPDLGRQASTCNAASYPLLLLGLLGDSAISSQGIMAVGLHPSP